MTKKKKSVYLKAKTLQRGLYKKLTNLYLPTETVDRPKKNVNTVFLITDISHSVFSISMI